MKLRKFFSCVAAVRRARGFRLRRLRRRQRERRHRHLEPALGSARRHSGAQPHRHCCGFHQPQRHLDLHLYDHHHHDRRQQHHHFHHQRRRSLHRRHRRSHQHSKHYRYLHRSRKNHDPAPHCDDDRLPASHHDYRDRCRPIHKTTGTCIVSSDSGISVTINPATAAVPTSQNFQFVATLTNDSHAERCHLAGHAGTSH